jgi:hypothetical protein
MSYSPQDDQADHDILIEELGQMIKQVTTRGNR